MDSIAIGKRAEQLACRYLKQNGLRHKASNYRCRQGEIDLIMEDGDTLVFVEVRYRKSNRFGSAAESIDYRKQSKLIACARHYITRQKLHHRNCRFDVISLDGPDKDLRLNWISNAFADS